MKPVRSRPRLELDRREFAKVAGLAAAGLAAGGLGPRLGHAGPGPEAKVFLAGLAQGAGDEAVAKAVREVAETATDFSWLARGDAVLIKPVCNSGNVYPATTSPAAVKAMAQLLKDRGAGRVILADMSGAEHIRQSPDRVKGSTRQLMMNNGLAQAAQSAGAELYFPEEHGWGAFFEDGPSGSSWKAGLMMPAILKEVDHVVLLPRCGRHVLAGSSLGLKAAVGYWRFDTRLEYHRDAASFQEKTAEANTVPCLRDKQRLVLTVATKVLTTFGPDDGYAREPETGLVYASDLITAHDTVSLAWLILGREQTPGEEKQSMIRDPYSSQTMVTNGNRLVVQWIGGPREMVKTEVLVCNELNAVSDDRALKRAYQLFGGAPKIQFQPAGGEVPAPVLERLKQMTGA